MADRCSSRHYGLCHLGGCHHNLWTVVQEQSPADAEGIARQIVSFSVHACSVIFPERKDETWLCPGGNVFSLHGRGEREQAALSNLYFSLSTALKEEREKRHSGRDWARQLGVIKLINLMPFVEHQTLHFSLCCLSSQPERIVYMMKRYEVENKNKMTTIANGSRLNINADTSEV